MIHNQRLSQTDQRGRILQYALEEFTKNGVRGVKMDKIAEALSMSKRTLYEMFGDKENLLLESIKYHKEITNIKTRKIFNKSKNIIEIYVRIMTLHIAEIKGIHPQFLKESLRYPSVRAFIEETDHERAEESWSFINRGIEEGFFKPNINYSFLLCIQDIIKKGIMQNKLYEKFSLEDISIFFFETQIRGICTENGLEELNRCWKLIKSEVADLQAGN